MKKIRVVSVGFSIHFAESFFFKRHSMVYFLGTFFDEFQRKTNFTIFATKTLQKTSSHDFDVR